MSGIKIMKFGAEWCNACTQADRYLDRTDKDRELKIERIDVDSNEELAVKFNVRNIPTFVAVKPNGEVVGRIVGFDKTKLEDFLKAVSLY